MPPPKDETERRQERFGSMLGTLQSAFESANEQGNLDIYPVTRLIDKFLDNEDELKKLKGELDDAQEELASAEAAAEDAEGEKDAAVLKTVVYRSVILELADAMRAGVPIAQLYHRLAVYDLDEGVKQALFAAGRSSTVSPAGSLRPLTGVRARRITS